MLPLKIIQKHYNEVTPQLLLTMTVCHLSFNQAYLMTKQNPELSTKCPIFTSGAPKHSVDTMGRSVTIHLGAVSNLDAGAHIKTTAGQLICQTADSGQKKTVKIPFSQIFSSLSIESSLEANIWRFFEFSLQCLISSGVCECS